MLIRFCFLSFCFCFLRCVVAGAESKPPATKQFEFFEKRIRPVLVEHCYECHSSKSDQLQGGLLLDTREGLRQGGDSGASVDLEVAEDSLLLSALRYEDFEMPPKGQLPEQVIRDFEHWIKMGAPDPRLSKSTVEPKKTTKFDLDEARKSWAFRSPIRHQLPRVADRSWPRNRIDFFILKRLEQRNLAPALVAERRQLARRVSYDLIGLPPSPDAVDRFVAGDSESSYEDMVDELISRPAFGERWARPWLDLARFAEDQAHIVGNNKSLFFPNAYYFRDWVIDSLNHDLAYDEFVKLQLAADLFEPENPNHQAALGFIGLGPKYYNRGRLEVKADEWEDRVDMIGRGLLGLTIACARCHDHKYDPITTEDYYGLAGVFASTEMYNHPLSEAKKGKNGEAKDPNSAIHIVREGTPQNLNVFIRGNVERKGPLVERRMPVVLCSGEPIQLTQGSGRSQLAQAIANAQNPLFARVFVNRIFGQLTGRAIVATPSNFGALGQPPSHPELLDDLSVRFMENGWSLKWLIREIVLSATYRQSSSNPQSKRLDPQNRFLWKNESPPNEYRTMA